MFFLAVAALAWLITGHTAHAAESGLLRAATARTTDEFGFASAADGALLAVTAPGDTDTSGAVHVFDCASLPCSAPVRLTAPEPDEGSRFGYSVDVSGNTLVVGQPMRGRGVVFVFVRTGGVWSLQSELTAFDGASNDRFGAAVSVSGDRLIVGAPHANHRQGVAYVYTRSGTSWSSVLRLEASDGDREDRFGDAVAISGDTVIVGAPMRSPATTGAFGQGAAYVFVRNGSAWDAQATLVPTSISNGALFGQAVDVLGDRAAIGAPRAAANVGRVHVFDRMGSTWTENASLTIANATVGAEVGRALALGSDVLMVGAPFAGNQDASCGLAQAFRFNGASWAVQPGATRVASDPRALVGWSVTASSQRWLLAAPGRPTQNLARAGAAYWFDTVGGVFADQYEDVGPGCLTPSV